MTFSRTRLVNEEAGTGIGMSRAYSLLRQHRASIEVETEPWMGTVIGVLFPRREIRARPVTERALAEVRELRALLMGVELDEGGR